MADVGVELPAAPEGTVNVLIVDDNPLDAELSQMALRRAGLPAEFVVVSDEAELRRTLARFAPDVVLCDFSFPGFDGLAAQQIVREHNPHTPLIFVSGTISEERAAAALRGGAVDYVMKSSLIRLPSAVRRSVQAARAAADVERLARQHAERLERLWRLSNDPEIRGPGLISVMLAEVAASLAPPMVFRGLLNRVEGDELVVIAVGAPEGPGAPSPAGTQLGERRRLEETAISRVRRSQGWADVAEVADMPSGLHSVGWRAVFSAKFVVGESTYAITFASALPAPAAFSEADYAYVDALASSVANQIQVYALEDSLRTEEERSRQHALRLESLWRIVNDPGLADPEKWLAMLAEAASSISPGEGFRGMLWRVDGENMNLEAAAESPGNLLNGSVLGVGESVRLSTSVIGKVLAAGGGTRSWDDVQASEFASELTASLGAHACVVTTFDAGGATWAISFVSGARTENRLGRQEHAFIEVLASFFANHVHQRWQFERIRYQQEHDGLTGLLNRAQFRAQAHALSKASARYAIVIINVNAFREINESYGHTTGDALLVEVGSALQGHALYSEVVGRVGGDVFAVYIPNPSSRAYVMMRAREFGSIFEEAFTIASVSGKELISRSASIGVAIAPDDGVLIDTVLSHADAALVMAKERGHGSTVFYEAGMERDAQRRATLRNEIAEALAGDQFELYFQPHIEIGTGRITGCEALIRWNHPVRGLVLPGHFIPFAEQAGTITHIDTWVMRNALKAAGELRALGPDFRLYFNLSGRQAGDPKLVRAFVEAARRGVALNNIGVEITETDAMRDVEATRRVCRALRRLGVRIAIDDFGTGYSSLSSLKRLPIDIVKIDRSFVSGVTTNAHDAAIVETIISITEHFGCESLGEGAEEPEEVEWLRSHKCRYVQGYAICYPLPMEAFQAWMIARERKPDRRRAPRSP